MNFEYVTQTLWKSTEVVPLRPQGSLWVCPNKYWIELVRRLCPEELPSKELGVLGWKGAWNMCFDSNKCIFLISDLWMKKKSIMGWWEEKEMRQGSLAGSSMDRKALGWQSCNGDAVLEGQTEPEPGQVPTSCCGWANITSSSSSFCTGRSVHSKFIIVLKTKQPNPAFDCDHGPDLHNSWISKLYGLLALCRL